jgi:hypothetical protein
MSLDDQFRISSDSNPKSLNSNSYYNDYTKKVASENFSWK